MTRRNCDELGTCQSRNPACTGCLTPAASDRSAPFAPGVIEGHRRHCWPQRLRLLAVWARCTGLLLLALAVVAAAAFAAGWLSGMLGEALS